VDAHWRETGRPEPRAFPVSVPQMVVRLEHRIVTPPAAVLAGSFTWAPAVGGAAPAVAVCETLQPPDGEPELYTPIVGACRALVDSWHLAPSTTRMADPEGWPRYAFWSAECLRTSGLDGVRHIGREFLFERPRLTSVDVSGLTGVVSIDDDFLFACTSLTAVAHVAAMSSLMEIGDNFLASCPALSAFDTSGLSCVTSIGAGFLSACVSISTFDCSGLTAVTTIDDRFLAECESLTSFDSHGLTSVANIGSHCISRCPNLSSVDASGLTDVERVGGGFLAMCASPLHVTGMEGLPEDIRRAIGIAKRALWC
jgi:hypothetical protein